MQRWLEAGTDKPGGQWVLEDRVVLFDWNREWAHLGSSSFTPTAQPDPATAARRPGEGGRGFSPRPLEFAQES